MKATLDSTRLLARGRNGLVREEGSALIETVAVVVLLFIPMMWVAVALERVEAVGYAVRAAARETSRTYVTSHSSGAGAARAESAGRLAFADQGVSPGPVNVSCTKSPCLTPDGQVSAHAVGRVNFPFVPGWLAGSTHLYITISSTHTEKVERYGGQR